MNMRRILFVFVCQLFFVAAFGASVNGVITSDDRGAVIGVEACEQSDGGVAFLSAFYKNFILTENWNKWEKYYSKRLTDKAFRKLVNDFDYDCEQGPCFAWWMFRIGGNDADTNGMRRTLKITPAGNGWYNVRMSDYGKPGTVKVRLVKRQGGYYIDDYVGQ